MNTSLIKIEKIREKLHLTQEGLAEKLGVSVRTIQNWEAGKVIPKTKHAILHTLLEGSDSKSITNELLLIQNKKEEESNNNISTPIYDIDATCGIEIRDYRDEKIIGWIDIPSINKEAIIIKASGDSMKPVIKDGSMIAIREIKSWDIIVFGQIYLVVTPEYRLLKYIRKSKDENIVILKSANEEFDDIELPKTQITKLFLVENVLSLKNLI